MLNTSTRTAIVETDTGRGYLKALGNHNEAPSVLACELLGTRLAEWLGLPVLDGALIELTDDDVAAYPNELAPSPGPAYITRAIDGHTWGGESSELEALDDPDVLAGLVVLDTWLLNCDRHTKDGRCNVRNVFFTSEDASKGGFRLLAIDHTHCFSCGRELKPLVIGSISAWKNTGVYGLFPGFLPFVTRAAAEVYVAKLKQFRRPECARMCHDIPRAWGWTSELAAAMSEFLERRAGFAAQYLLSVLESECDWDRVLDFDEGDNA